MTPELEEHLARCLRKLESSAVSVRERKELPYGIQLKLHKGNRTCAVNLYHSRKKGSSVVGSGGDGLLLNEVLEMLAASGHKENLPYSGTRTGTDEAGKGDYFGPLVAAAVWCPREKAEKLKLMGAGDSKRLSARTVRELYEKITEMDGIVYSVCSIPPGEYNSLFAGFSSRGMNSLDIQAMAHGKAISGVLRKTGDLGTLVIDRFCDMKRLKPWLPEELGNIVLMVKAEDKEPAVAAASILARSVYLEQLSLISGRYGMDLRPGAGHLVDQAGRQLVSRFGSGVLPDTAKLHFSNTQRITGGLDLS